MLSSRPSSLQQSMINVPTAVFDKWLDVSLWLLPHYSNIRTDGTTRNVTRFGHFRFIKALASESTFNMLVFHSLIFDSANILLYLAATFFGSNFVNSVIISSKDLSGNSRTYAELILYTESRINGYAILWLTNVTLDLESSSTPVNTTFSPRASCLSAVLTYAIRAVVETYLPGWSFESVTDGIGSRNAGGGVGRVRGSGYKSLNIWVLELWLVSLLLKYCLVSTNLNHSPLFYRYQHPEFRSQKLRTACTLICMTGRIFYCSYSVLAWFSEEDSICWTMCYYVSTGRHNQSHYVSRLVEISLDL